MSQNPKLTRIHLKSLMLNLEKFKQSVQDTVFTDEDNRENALDEVESMLISLDDLEDILDRDAELAIIRQSLNESTT
jgi:hypothetical protein